MQTDKEEIIEEIDDIISSHAIFLNGGYDDSVHHLIGPEATEALSFLIFYLATPILTGITSNFLAELIKKRGGALVKLGITSGPMHVKGDKHFVDEHIITMEEVKEHADETCADEAPIILEKVKEAQDSLYSLLMSNGWPSSVAESDAKEMINVIISKHHGKG